MHTIAYPVLIKADGGVIQHQIEKKENIIYLYLAQSKYTQTLDYTVDWNIILIHLGIQSLH